MDRNLFSRGSTPPIPPNFAPQAQRTSPPNHLESLLQNLTAPSQSSSAASISDQQSISSMNTYGSEPTTPIMVGMSTADESSVSSLGFSHPNAFNTSDRKSALLSLLGTVSNPGGPNGGGRSGPQRVPTPPTATQRVDNESEVQGKNLLEQLMSGNVSRTTNYDQPPPSVLTPPYTLGAGSQADSGYQDSSSYPSSSDMEFHNDTQRVNHNQPQPYPPYYPQPPQSQLPQPSPPQQHQAPPSPPRKSMFDFISPFDALASTTGQKKSAQVPLVAPSGGSSGNEESWQSIADPKRKSVENLMDQLTRGQPPLAAAPPLPIQQGQGPYDSPQQGQGQQMSIYDSYLGGGNDDLHQPPLSSQQPAQASARGALPPIPFPNKTSPNNNNGTLKQGNRAPSPIGGRNGTPPQPMPEMATGPTSYRSQPQQPPAGPPTAVVQAQVTGRGRDKEGSPGPGSRFRNKKGKNQGQTYSPGPQAQNIVFDVSQPLEEVQAPKDALKATAIALVKQDAVFLPGTTIGATHWVAYAMTRGRVRVISRSSGDRTLLQLPQVFPSSSSVVDMATFGNRLAGVTSDGGFVVWELPEVITDDVPGMLLLCVPPSADAESLHAVKWHPKQQDLLAVASDSKMFLIDLEMVRSTRGQPLSKGELNRIAEVFPVNSRLVAFDFDVANFALASMCEDSMLTSWSITEKVPYWSFRVRGDEIPSSVTFVDNVGGGGSVVIGRKNGTIFQLLSLATRTIVATVSFINGGKEDPDMFGHVNYDSRIRTLWVANCRRDSVIAFKIGLEDTHEDPDGRPFFEQFVEFVGPKPTIHFVILTADADPHGEEAKAACVAAKVAIGDLALVAFSVHSSGVDQILIRREWFDNAMTTAPAKFPNFVLPPSQPQVQPSFNTLPPVEAKNNQRQQLTQQAVAAASNQGLAPPPRQKTPPSEDVDGDLNREDGGRSENRGKGQKGKNVNFKDKEDGKDKDKVPKANDATLINESLLGQALSREIKKTEESLHTRIGRLIGKEMDKQHQRLEDARAHEQAEDFARQEKILKLISTELTRNTTRVVEMAVKNEVQNSVLPSLENITKNEVKAALNEQVGRGMSDYIQQNLPVEIEKLLLRPDISAHFAHILSSNLTPLIERNIKDVVSKTFLPAYSQQASAMHQDLVRELRSEIHLVKKELIGFQDNALRGQETLIRDLEHTVRALSEQVKILSMNTPPPVLALHHQIQQGNNSPGPNNHLPQASIGHNGMQQSHLRQANMPPPVSQAPSNYSQAPYPQQQQPPMMPGPWFNMSSIAAPQASHPIAPPPPPPQPLAPMVQQRTPPAKAEDWDETYLAVLGSSDVRQLRDLLARSNPEVVMPSSGPSPLSQAVILTLLHRIAALVGETPPVDESFKSSLWWLQRTATTLNTTDPLISPYVPRVVPNVLQMLNTTKSRLNLLPGGPQLHEAARTITEVQDTLNRKP